MEVRKRRRKEKSRLEGLEYREIVKLERYLLPSKQVYSLEWLNAHDLSPSLQRELTNHFLGCRISCQGREGESEWRPRKKLVDLCQKKKTHQRIKARHLDEGKMGARGRRQKGKKGGRVEQREAFSKTKRKGRKEKRLQGRRQAGMNEVMKD